MTMVRFHTIMMCVWALLLIPTVIWWKESILWVAFMSIYANFVGHFSSRQASKADKRAKENGDG